ncbi:hypothetical protein LG324_08035 [Phycicoccus jejuensis]|uniref:hypothetical protein n=1 Tax=Phycicoccus jejuensis TaxID=367299 RepID=UPI003850B2F7
MTGRIRRAAASPLAGFGAVLAVQLVGGVVQTVGLLATLGPVGWATVSVGQIAGFLGATLASGGLVTFGGSLVATSEPAERPGALLGTLRARVVCAGATFAVLLLVLSAISPGPLAVSATTAAATLASSLAASWYFIGRGEPARWLKADVLPFNAAAVAGVALTWVYPSSVAYALVYAAGASVAVVLSLRAVRADHRPAPAPPQSTVASFLVGHRALLATGAAAGVNGQGPALLMAASGAPAVPTFLLLDRLVRYVVAGAAPLVQVTQSWVPGGGAEAMGRRARRALATTAVVAGLVSVAFGALSGPVVSALSSGDTAVPGVDRVLFSVLVAVLVLTQVNALAVMVPLGLGRVLAVSTSLGAVAIALGGGVAAALGGLRSILAVTLVVELAVLLVQLRAVRRTTSR